MCTEVGIAGGESEGLQAEDYIGVGDGGSMVWRLRDAVLVWAWGMGKHGVAFDGCWCWGSGNIC